MVSNPANNQPMVTMTGYDWYCGYPVLHRLSFAGTTGKTSQSTGFERHGAATGDSLHGFKVSKVWSLTSRYSMVNPWSRVDMLAHFMIEFLLVAGICWQCVCSAIYKWSWSTKMVIIVWSTRCIPSATLYRYDRRIRQPFVVLAIRTDS